LSNYHQQRTVRVLKFLCVSKV